MEKSDQHMANEFTVRWVNRHDQAGAVMLDCVISDLSGVMPEWRVHKHYRPASPEDVDEAFLTAEAAREVELRVRLWNEEQERLAAEAEAVGQQPAETEVIDGN